MTENWLEETIRALLKALKKEVTSNVVIMKSQGLTEIAELPALLLSVPRITEVGQSNMREVSLDIEAGMAEIAPPRQLVDLEFDCEITAGNVVGSNSLWQLSQRALGTLRKLKRQKIAVTLQDRGGKAVVKEYDVSYTDFTQSRQVFQDQLMSLMGTIVIHRVEIPPMTVEIQKVKLTQRIYIDMYEFVEGGKKHAESTSCP